jgi:hypothetical protein
MGEWCTSSCFNAAEGAAGAHLSRLRRPESRFGPCAEERNLLSLPGIESPLSNLSLYRLS